MRGYAVNLYYVTPSYSLSFIRLLWSWGDLNPRPNAELMCFLRAYFRLGFRAAAGAEHPTTALVS